MPCADFDTSKQIQTDRQYVVITYADLYPLRTQYVNKNNHFFINCCKNALTKYLLRYQIIALHIFQVLFNQWRDDGRPNWSPTAFGKWMFSAWLCWRVNVWVQSVQVRYSLCVRCTVWRCYKNWKLFDAKARVTSMHVVLYSFNFSHQTSFLMGFSNTMFLTFEIWMV